MSRISDELREWAAAQCNSLALYKLADRIDAEMAELPRGKDGRPIHVDETVYTANGKEFHVIGIDFDRLEHRIEALDESHCTCIIAASLLTHERPDSWSRIADELDEQAAVSRRTDTRGRRTLFTTSPTASAIWQRMRNQMTPTSDERREVAARLRKTQGIKAFVKSLGIDLNGDWCWTDVSRRVADLIDPTCRNRLDEFERMAPLGMRTDNFVCSSCGETFCADPDGVNFPIDWAYCPNCGARITRITEVDG